MAARLGGILRSEFGLVSTENSESIEKSGDSPWPAVVWVRGENCVLRRTGFVCREPPFRYKSFQDRKVIARATQPCPNRTAINPTEFIHGRLSGSYRS